VLQKTKVLIGLS